MFIDLTPEQHTLRMKVRDYFNNLMTPELRLKLRGAESGDEYRQTIRQMGKDGWLAVGWPKAHGGQGLSATEQLIFFEEANIAGAPLPFVTISTVGPALMESGSEAQKARFLPGIAAGELIFSIGYSEPQAGSDLAVLKTQAKLEGDLQTGRFIVNGSKLWTSGIEAADHVWLAARTDPNLTPTQQVFLIPSLKPSATSLQPRITTMSKFPPIVWWANCTVAGNSLPPSSTMSDWAWALGLTKFLGLFAKCCSGPKPVTKAVDVLLISLGLNVHWQSVTRGSKPCV